ncbi:MAG: TonB family protein [Terriglobia bacterium]
MFARLAETADGNAREVLSYDGSLSGRVSGRALALSVTLHVLVIVTPLPAFLFASAQQSAPPTIRIEVDLEGSSSSAAPVLPPIFPVRTAKEQPSPGGEENQPLPAPGAEHVQPQTIVSDPPEPNHPRQTLLRPQALEAARLQVPDVRLPNVVIPPAPDAGSTLSVNPERLPASRATPGLPGASRAPMPPRPRSAAELALKTLRLENLTPRLTLPRPAPGEDTSAAPEVSAPLGVARGGNWNAPALLALSVQPAAPRPVLELPDTNLRAQFTAGPYAGSGSPGGVPGGLPDASGGSGGGLGGLAGGAGSLVARNILVAPAGPVPPAPVVTGSGDGTGPSAEPPAGQSPAAGPEVQSTPRREEPPSPSPEQRAQALQEAVQQSGKAGGRPIYTTYLFLANLTSQSSTWRLRFVPRAAVNRAGGGGSNGGNAASSTKGIVSSPVAVKKVDPCYPAAAGRERIEGTVVLYGVIRADGGVEDVVVVSGLAAELDQRAAGAFARSRFEPARAGGRAVAVEVLVEIPFRLAACL